MVKPNLFVIGAPKCGSTFFHNVLKQHPEAHASVVKEPFYFNDLSSRTEAEYLHLFRGGEDKHIVFESTPIYSETNYFSELPRLLYEFNPESKIIYLVRSPIPRLKSMWAQAKSRGHDTRRTYFNDLMPKDFDIAVFEYPLMLSTTCYWDHYDNYLKYFTAKNIKVIFFEDLVADLSSVMFDVCGFLGISPDWNFSVEDIDRNSRVGKKVYPAIFYDLAKNTPIVRKLVPRKLLDILLSTFKDAPVDVSISGSTLHKIKDKLEIPARKFLSSHGKREDFWHFD